LQDKVVQRANFGRELTGTPDALPACSTVLIAIADPGVVATKTHHTIAQRSADSAEEVAGTLFRITPEELVAAVRDELSDYTPHTGDAEVAAASVGLCASVSVDGVRSGYRHGLRYRKRLVIVMSGRDYRRF
jgi:hypothetical protein